VRGADLLSALRDRLTTLDRERSTLTDRLSVLERARANEPANQQPPVGARDDGLTNRREDCALPEPGQK
jgi:hypothetical protein